MTPPASARVATWNLKWRSPHSQAAAAIRARLDPRHLDVVVATEARKPMLDDWPYIEMARGGRYPGTPEDGSKVTIVSNHRFSVVDHGATDELINRNLLVADIGSGDSALRVVGVVVRYLQISDFTKRLADVLRPLRTDRMVVAGDFNLTVPGGPRSRDLEDVLASLGLTVRTRGPHAELAEERPLRDHIAASEELRTDGHEIWPRCDQYFRDGTVELTDHAGAAVDLHVAK